ncbi:MAG TPA: chemotaxis protein CheW [Thermoanaerobaculia bacterium]
MPQPKELRLIAFRTGPQTFVIDIMAVRQIIVYGGTTAVPAAPPFVEGIVVVRSEVIPVIDLRERFGIDDAQRSPRPLVLITETSAGPIGLKVDEVRRIVNVSTDAFLPPPAIVGAIRGDLLIAIVEQDDEVYLLLDVESVLTADEKTELQSAELSSEESRGTSGR